MASFVSVLHSHTFKFLIGPDEKPVIVHSAAISKLSEPLDRLMNGATIEAQERCVRLRDLEVEDFERICEFAYRGDFVSPTCIETGGGARARKCEPKGQTWNDTNNEKSEDDDESPPRVWERRETGLGRLTAHFEARQYDSKGLARDRIAELFDVRYNRFDFQDFSPIFLGYARLYAFAEMYMARDLKTLTLHKLHLTLCGFTLFESCRPAVVGLARFAYDNECIPDQGVNMSIDKLRLMVVEYIAMHTRDFKYCVDYRRLLNEEGEFAGDLLGMLEKWRL